MPGHMTLNSRKFKELVVYISGKNCDKQFFGSLKLNKALFFADFLHYAIHGKSITGATYTHLPQGPAPSCLVPLRRELLTDGSINMREEHVFGRMQKRIVPNREANVSIFSSTEIALIDQILDEIKDRNGTELSDLTHTYLSWILTREGEEIPYHSIFLSNEPVSERDIQQARELLALAS